MKFARQALIALALTVSQQAGAHTPAYFGFVPKVEFTEPALGSTVKYVRSVTFTDVEAGSPAEKAGVRAGDEVLAIGAKPLAKWTDAQFDRFVHGLKPGKRLALKVRHSDGTNASISVVGVKQ